ncbi:MAG: acireductone synthase [Candidatus Competibacteraceae bacterium]|jgi:enolase-phosphatase E1|nr:acireductone synthase [Candidatus Competibacteraceae bacterium]
MVQVILTDIEGTTSSLSFVKEVLFPYAREHLPEFIHTQATQPAVAQLLEDAREAAGTVSSGQDLINQLLAWIDADRKVTPLKALQGLIWEDGYRRGDFTGHVYEDAARCLRAWQTRDIALYIYSSGSVYAQQLLFAHTDYGDLTPLFSGYFDTVIGPKQEIQSYRAIANEIGLAPQDMLFLSDTLVELDAARAAGMQTWQLVRHGPLDDASSHPQARNFDAIKF